ncbi:hypothetical protein [Kordiimonas sp. SCSIO 12610]|nr:hypothetical protein [Kordiimonas sp. SCSIO 12610]UTW56154.1 hypothetical protein KFF44_04460 [Kordiimonas sp. SCSIO 12610]
MKSMTKNETIACFLALSVSLGAAYILSTQSDDETSPSPAAIEETVVK